MALMFLERYEEAPADLAVVEGHDEETHPAVLVGRAGCLHRAGREAEASVLALRRRKPSKS